MIELWFDVERRYKTISAGSIFRNCKLWFDVERRYKTIVAGQSFFVDCCGLMQKDDIRQ